VAEGEKEGEGLRERRGKRKEGGWGSAEQSSTEPGSITEPGSGQADYEMKVEQERKPAAQDMLEEPEHRSC
jgi:hypothetical protein